VTREETPVRASLPGGFQAAAQISASAAARAPGENFPVALRVLPARYRVPLMAVYAYARTVDEAGDSGDPGGRLGVLEEIEADLRRLFATGAGSRAQDRGHDSQGGPRLPVILGLGPVVAGCGVGIQPFLDLIRANQQDQLVSRYQTFADLLGYCELSANPVGRIVLHIFGYATPERAELSDRVCSALQVIEHCQDVAEDLRAGRIYLPGEDLARFGCSEAMLAEAAAGPAVRALLEFEARRAAALLDDGARLIGTLRGWARLAIAGYVAGGRAALAAIAAADYDVLRATPRPRRFRVVASSLAGSARGR
jgi:squalene synthase HpnC